MIEGWADQRAAREKAASIETERMDLMAFEWFNPHANRWRVVVTRNPSFIDSDSDWNRIKDALELDYDAYRRRAWEPISTGMMSGVTCPDCERPGMASVSFFLERPDLWPISGDDDSDLDEDLVDAGTVKWRLSVEWSERRTHGGTPIETILRDLEKTEQAILQRARAIKRARQRLEKIVSPSDD